MNLSSNLLVSIPPQSWRWSIPMLDFQSCPIVAVNNSNLWKVTNLEYSIGSCRFSNDVIVKTLLCYRVNIWGDVQKGFLLHESARSPLTFGLVQNNVLLRRLRKVDWWFIFIKNNVTKNSLFTCRVFWRLFSVGMAVQVFPATYDRPRSTWYITSLMHRIVSPWCSGMQSYTL